MILRSRRLGILILAFVSLVMAKAIVPEISWDRLEGHDYMTGKSSQQVKMLLNNKVSITGYWVPIDMGEDYMSIKSFIMMPYTITCMHIPPPSPNQLIYVELKKSIPIQDDFYMLKVTGTLLLHGDMDAVYRMKGEEVIAVEEPITDPTPKVEHN